ncbi:RNA polymerase sigma factor SigM [Nocardioides sp. AX2bis]|uniref:RNA polymerase sigma factor SigM n=1 Tax=Nocardioides sp. AX2bis TaxID=2653157 RepID=UPI0013575C2E|nr:RNA polymerase sigma factor SigM [Nocardioides sp. AX2bis]
MPEPAGGRTGSWADPRDDAALLAAHVAGDAEAFGVLVRRHQDRLWAVALRTCGHPEDAADALQEALVAAHRRAATFRGEAAVTTWLHRVVVNACLDRLRAAKVRRADPLPDDLADRPGTTADGVPAGLSSSAQDPAAAAVTADRRRRVLAALATLPAPQRAAIVLVDLEGYSVAEAAEVLDCAVGTVKSRCSRGRASLATLLRPLLDDTEDGPDGPLPSTGNHPASRHVPSTPPRGPPPRA